MDTKILFLVTLLALFWSVQPFARKKLLKKFSNIETVTLEYSLFSIIVLGYFIYLWNQNHLSMFKRLDKSDCGTLLTLVIIMTLASFTYAYIISHSNTSTSVPITQSLTILFLGLIGYFIFKEDFNKYKILGTILIIAGINLMNTKDFYHDI